MCCWSGCDIARCGDNCASYCLASAGDDQLQTKTMTMGIPFVFPGLDAAEVAAVLFLSSSLLLSSPSFSFFSNLKEEMLIGNADVVIT